MSSTMGQSILIALTATVNKCASSNLHAVHTTQATPTLRTNMELGRRGILLSTAIATATTQEPDSRIQLLKKYQKKSEENKEKNDKERLESYYKRNYKDYFGTFEGTLKAKNGPLSDTEKSILDWLQSNK